MARLFWGFPRVNKINLEGKSLQNRENRYVYIKMWPFDDCNDENFDKGNNYDNLQ